MNPFDKNHQRLSSFIGGAIVLAILCGCESDEGPTAHDRQDAAMRDPFNYNPDSDLMTSGKKDDVDPTDISGGGTGTLDRKALKRDLDSVFNP